MCNRCRCHNRHRCCNCHRNNDQCCFDRWLREQERCNFGRTLISGDDDTGSCRRSERHCRNCRPCCHN